MVTESSPFFAKLPDMLTAHFNNSSANIKDMRAAATAIMGGNGGEVFVKDLDKAIKAALKNNDIMNALMSRCIG